MSRYSNKNSVLEQLFFVHQHTSYSTFIVTLLYCYLCFIVTFIRFIVTLCIYNFILQNILFSSLALSHRSDESDIGQGKKNTCIIKYTLLCKFLRYIKLCKCKLLVMFCFIYSWKKWLYL